MQSSPQVQQHASQQSQQLQQQQREPVQVDPRARMNMVNQGIHTSSAMDTMGSPTSGGSLTLESIVDMSDAEFNRFTAEHPGIVDALLGS